MMWPFKKSLTPSEPVFAVYNAIVAQSRQEQFYADWSVSDTVTGRFDMICLHMCLVLRRLRPDAGGDRDFNQALFDLFFKDMDRSLREMGVGDVSVPKRIQKMGGVFYGLLGNLTDAIDSKDEQALVGVVERNFYDDADKVSAPQLAQYTRDIVTRLDEQPVKAIIAGDIEFGEVQ